MEPNVRVVVVSQKFDYVVDVLEALPRLLRATEWKGEREFIDSTRQWAGIVDMVVPVREDGHSQTTDQLGGSLMTGDNTATYAPKAEDLDVPVWKKSSFSVDDRHAALGRTSDGQIALRNLTDPTGPAILYTPAQFEEFARGLRAGDFNEILGFDVNV